jgi:flagellar biosynthesis protein FliR
METLAPLVTVEIYRFFLVFVRVGAAVMAMPGFGEFAVPVRLRLCIALAVAFVLTPNVPGLSAAAVSAAPAPMLEQFFCETAIGLFLGLGAKMFLAAMQVAGAIAAQAIGLSNPFNTELGGFEGGTLLSGTLVIAGLAVIFATDTHYLMLDAVARSYETMPAGQVPDFGMLAGRISQLVSSVFRLGVGMAAPFLLFGVLGNLVLGLVNRVMPAMPVYFVGTPALLAAGIYAFVLTSGAMIIVAMGAMTDWLSGR